MATANALIARIDAAEPQYRASPSNIDAEQALLGAILVNNDAYYRVSDFLEAGHFFEDLHRRIYEVATSLIKAGKVATPITMKTFLGDQDLGGVTVSQYLARLAAEATTVINAEDYGRTIYDLADPPQPDQHRRGHGQRRLRRAGRNLSPRPDRGGGAAPLRAGRNRPLRRRLPALLRCAHARHRHGGRRLQARRQAVGHLDRPDRPRQHARRPAALRSGHPRRPSRRWARPRSSPTSRSTSPRPTRASEQPDGTHEDRQRRHRRLLLPRNVGRAAGDPYHRRAIGRAVLQDPPRRHARGRFLQDHRSGARDAVDPVLHRPDRRHLDRPARGARPASEAPARPRRAGRRLPAAALRAPARRARTACRS